VGGMRDEAEIKGHRRTYIGSMPGKIIQALKVVQTMNPVIMLDEIDKIGQTYHGDPASALLEVFDPEQNKEFLDHYLDVRCDLSHILFIVTANVLDTIPEPLKDRMDVMRLSGYILEEKLQITKRYLIPKNRKAMGLQQNEVVFQDKAIIEIAQGYAREAGLRSMENYIKKILRKISLKIVRGSEKESRESLAPCQVRVDNLQEYIGKPQHLTDRYYIQTPVGVAMGLAWTAQGGATLYVEAIKVASEKTEMKLTGQAGDVMKESAQIAWSVLQSRASQYQTDPIFFKQAQIHLHIPAGAVPKDGPSAGITMLTAMLSLVKQQPVLEGLGMTGELTLTGKVLPIGGVKEKVVAARRSKVQALILPKENQKDYAELSASVKKGLKVHFVDDYDEVYHVAFS